MVLYTINGVYPDKNFNFTVDAEDLQLVPEDHIHTTSEIQGFSTSISGKARAVHSHTAVTHLTTGNEEDVDILTLNSVAVTGYTDTCDLSISGQTLSLSYISPDMGVAGTVMNANTTADAYVIQLSTVDNASIIAPAQGHLFVKERTVDLVTQYAEEFIKHIEINEAGSDPITITKALTYEKLAAGSRTKEIWPIAAARIHVHTNYDKASGQRVLPNSAYSGPYITRAALQTKPIQMTVIVYPESAAWKLGHSSNITDSTLFNTVFKGTQTVSVPFSMVDASDDPQAAWISAYPATEAGTANEVKFQFWCAWPTSGSGSGSGSGDSGESGGSADPSGPVNRWLFKGATPLVDVVHGKSLITDKNPSDPSMHVVTGGVGESGSLINILPAIEKHMMLRINGANYDYSSSIDNPVAQHAKYAWFNADLEQAYYTAAANPSIGDPVYLEDETQTEYTIEDKWELNSNYFETNIDVDEANEAITMTGYIRQNMSCVIWAGNSLKADCYAIKYFSPRLVISPTDSGAGFANVSPDKHESTYYYTWVVYASEVMTPQDPAFAYTEERGYGFIVKRALRIFNLGWPYVRDSVRDVNGLYAFTWISAGMTGNDTVPVYQEAEVPTLYAASENPSVGDTLYYADGTAFPLNIGAIPVYELEFIDSRYGNTPYTQVWRNNKNNNSEPFNGRSGWSHVREMVYFLNGVYRGTKVSNGFYTGFGTGTRKLTIAMEDATAAKNTYLSDLCIYNRALTMEEIEDHAAGVWGTVAPGQSATKFEPTGKLQIQVGIIKIHVGDGWYIYNPYLTKLTPTDTDPYASHYGWDLFSGTGPDHLWTVNYPPTNADFCCTTDDGAPDTSKRVRESANVAMADYPMHCKLIPYVLDAKTLAIGIWTHDAVIRHMRTNRPFCEATYKKIELHKYTESWVEGQDRNLPIWDTQVKIQPEICQRLDNESNWTVDGNAVVLRSRMYTCPFQFEPTKFELQFRNVTPDHPFYAHDPGRNPGTSYWTCPELVQWAYLTLPTPMVTGSTHTVQWCDDTCTVTYGPQQYSATIKVNQEGYLPFSGITRYAYLGRWMGPDTYMPDQNNRQFYIVPSGSTDESHAVFSGTMTQRCVAGQNTGLKKDKYGQGDYKEWKPLTGENTFEMDFTNLSTVTKTYLVAGGTTYYRDVVEDWTDGSITLSGGTDSTWSTATYDRSPADDTCNAYAWRTTPANGEPSLVYTERHTPDTTEQARTTFDPGDGTEYFDVTGSTEFQQYGWTTERTQESDYTTAQTVFTTAATGATSVVKVDGSTVSVTSESSGETADITGKYQIYVPGIGWSHEFLIHPEIMTHQFWVSMRGMFHQRGGCDDVKHPYTNWEHPSGIITRVYEGNYIPFDDGQAKDPTIVWRVDNVSHEPYTDEYGGRPVLSNSGKGGLQCAELDKYQTQVEYSIFGGWMDAADYDLREQHLPIIQILSDAYLLFPDNFTDGQCEIPESGNGMPDILSEALRGAELYRRMQMPDGGIRAWFETGGDAFSPHVPWKSNAKYYACAPSMKMSIYYAGPAAHLAMALKLAASRTSNAAAKTKMLSLAKAYTESACAAFEYGTQDYSAPWTRKPDEEREPKYYFTQGNTWAWREWIDVLNDFTDLNSSFKPFGISMFKAASALYTLTRESRFKAWLNSRGINKYIEKIPGFDATASFDIAVEWISMLDDDMPEAAQRIRTAYVALADNWRTMQATHPYRWHYWTAGGVNTKFGAWGSTHADKRGMCQIVAWLITGDIKYRNAIINGYDHMCGCNPLGRSFTPWVGKVFPNRYLDHWTRWDILTNGYESAMPGVSPDMGYNYPVYIKELECACGMKGEKREWFTGAYIDAYPQKCRQVWGMSKSNWRAAMYFKWLPLYQGWALFGQEDQGEFIQCYEWTVEQTIGPKAAIAGMLMTPGVKTRPKWKQIDRIKREDNLPNVIVLP